MRWIVGGLMAVAIALAPVAPAFGCPPEMQRMDAAVAATMESAAHTGMSAMHTAPAKPCDSPCDDCSPDAAEKTCAGICVFATSMIAVAPASLAARTPAVLVEPHALYAPAALARPPDTPPPRSLA
jgi:hypothetical protein